MDKLIRKSSGIVEASAKSAARGFGNALGREVAKALVALLIKPKKKVT